jgi:adenylate cyclase
MTAMTQTILNKRGTLDKYIGDAQMAFWNAPILDEEHAVHAVESAIQMLTDLDNFNAEISQEGIPPFGMGIGINTGNVVVGNMGSSQRFDYTCLGDAVNLASRLEGQSKSYGVRLVLGPETAKLIENKYSVTELDCIAVKGKTIGVKIYTVGTPHELHADYLDLYYKGDWKKAKVVCEKIIKDGTSAEEYYLLMIKRLETGVPENWDGTYRATSK